MDPSRALLALHTLKCDSTSPSAIQRYQDEFVTSRISALTETISEILKRPRDVKSLGQIHGALSACDASLTRARHEIDEVCAIISELAAKVEEARAKVQGEVFGTAEQDEVAKALQGAEKSMKVTLEGLTWWKMTWRIDSIGEIVGAAAEKCWCPQLEKQVSVLTASLNNS
jgi:hypothetical protein